MTRVVADDPAGRALAISALRAGDVVALPTDTVYGIAVELRRAGGIERLFAAKGRPPDKAIMVLLAEAEQAADVGVVTDAAHVLARTGWPGGLTLVLRQRADAGLPAVLTGGAPTIGVRLPDHPTPRALARAVGPLPTTSANLAGHAVAASAAEIVEQLGDAVAVVLDGRAGPRTPRVDRRRLLAGAPARAPGRRPGSGGAGGRPRRRGHRPRSPNRADLSFVGDRGDAARRVVGRLAGPLVAEGVRA